MTRIAFLLGLLVVSAPRVCEAQACCSSGTPTELAALASSDDAAILAQVGYEHAFGTADSASEYHALSGVSADDGSLTFAGGIRLFPRDLQLGAVVPLRVQHRSLRGVGSSTQAGVGDSTLALRFRALEAARWIPSLDLILGLRIPTGRAPEDSSDETLADATGKGVYAPSAGAKLTFEITPLDTVFVRGEHALSLPHDVNGERVNLGDETTLELGYLRALSLSWFAGALVDLQLVGETSTNGTNAPDSDQRRVRLGAWLTWMWHSPTWDSTLAVISDPYWNGAEKNVPFAGIATTLSVRRVFR